MNAPPKPRARPRQFHRGEAEFMQAAAAFFIGGFAIFALLYGVQPILQTLAREFAVSPASMAILMPGALAVAWRLAHGPPPARLQRQRAR